LVLAALLAVLRVGVEGDVEGYLAKGNKAG
jgi:hypothetical protein